MSESTLKVPEDNTQTVVFEVIPADICMEWLADKIGEARHRSVVQAMAMQEGSHISPVFDVLARRAKDLDHTSRLIVDGYSMVFDDVQTTLLPGASARAARRAVKSFCGTLDDLQEAGVQVGVVNRYMETGRGLRRFNPFANRNHTKGYVIDDMVALAGPNLTDSATESFDFLLVAESERLADWWDAFTHHEYLHGRVPNEDDYVVPIDKESHVLVDVGKPGSSLIYDTACEWLEADDVAHVYYVNQLFPTGAIAKKLGQLQQSIGENNVEIVTSHYNHFGQPARASQQWRQRRASFDFYTSEGAALVHTKTLIVTKTNGEQIAMVTSNNLDERGVKYGTTETAIVTKNIETIANIKNYCDDIPRQKFG